MRDKSHDFRLAFVMMLVGIVSSFSMEWDINSRDICEVFIGKFTQFHALE